jgi:pimeloyl-ACP methyl ester carboxylesterase
MFKGEFHRLTTEDGLELHGILARPRRRTRTAVLHVHGWDGNFYENRFIDHAARVCLKHNLGFFTANNRGHDYLADVLRTNRGEHKFEYVQLGGVHESMADCLLDIRACVRFLESQGFDRAILQGHSHGATKVAWYLYRTKDKRVPGLVLLSPSDDLGLIRRGLGKRFPEALDFARYHIHNGRPRKLMPEDMFQYPVSAATFLDTFGPDSIAKMFNMSRTDRLRFPELATIRVPVLVAVGTVDEAFIGDSHDYVRNIKACLTSAPSVSTSVISRAPHNFLGHETRLARVLDRWLGRLVSKRK